MLQKEKEHEVHVEYDVQQKDKGDGELIYGLTIKTPLAMIIVTDGLDMYGFNGLMSRLIDKFGYAETEIIPLKVSKSRYDFILITDEVIEERPLGITFSDRDGGQDGHELEVSAVISKFSSDLHDTYRHQFGCDDDREIGMVYGSYYYGSEKFISNIESDVDMQIIFKETEYGLTDIIIFHRGIYFEFSLIDEACVPYDTTLPLEDE